MKDAGRIDLESLNTQIQKVKDEFKDDPERLQKELEQLDAKLTQNHPNTFYRDLSTGRTVRASWRYSGAKFAIAPTDTLPAVPQKCEHVAVIPGRNQKLTIELGNQLPDEGIMRVRVRASRTSPAAEQDPSLQLMFGWQASNEGRALMRVGTKDALVTADPDRPEFYQWDIPIGEIYPRNSVRKTSPMGVTPSPSEYIRLANSSATQGEIQVDYVEISAPVYDQWPPESHKRIFFDSKSSGNESAYAREILTAFMTRAWRRRVTDTEIDKKLDLYHQIRDYCDSFEDAVVDVLATVLSSPQFLYVVREHEEDKRNDGAFLTDHELATRLSMFLWCSIPDERLLKLADTGQLSNPDVLYDEVSRMLADARAERFSKHFVHQWLDMQLLDFLDFKQHVRGFDPLLKEAMQYEPIALFHEVLQNNESVLNFIHSEYTMADERLANHYGLGGVYGNEFRRVSFTAGNKRGGLLTQAGLLAMNSDGEDSHPLKRGIWLLECLLNDPPPPPPPAVPEIDLADPEIAKMTLKERIENHRNHAACRSCHVKIDPWGIAFENYDALGRWRDQIKGKPVDASSLLFNNQELNGIEGLKRFLLTNRQDQFVRALVYKMATFALGRPLTFADHAAIDRITADVRKEGDGLATVVLRVATSELFRLK